MAHHTALLNAQSQAGDVIDLTQIWALGATYRRRLAVSLAYTCAPVHIPRTPATA